MYLFYKSVYTSLRICLLFKFIYKNIMYEMLKKVKHHLLEASMDMSIILATKLTTSLVNVTN